MDSSHIPTGSSHYRVKNIKSFSDEIRAMKALLTERKEDLRKLNDFELKIQKKLADDITPKIALSYGV